MTQAFITMNETLTCLAITARSFTSERRAQNISGKKDWAGEDLIWFPIAHMAACHE